MSEPVTRDARRTKKREEEGREVGGTRGLSREQRGEPHNKPASPHTHEGGLIKANTHSHELLPHPFLFEHSHFWSH